MEYAYFENGQIIKRGPLPKTWKNVSNFHLLDNDRLKNFGWLPYVYVYDEIPDGYRVNGYHIVIEENQVVEYQDIIEITPYEIESSIENGWSDIREQRTEILSKTDWTQVLDSPFTEEEKESWRLYRQALRDITLQADPFNIIWPTPPGQINE